MNESVSSENVNVNMHLYVRRYAKGLDPDNWLIIDPKTAEIKLNKKPDRESHFLVNGTYYAEILSITEGKHLSFLSRLG